MSRFLSLQARTQKKGQKETDNPDSDSDEQDEDEDEGDNEYEADGLDVDFDDEDEDEDAVMANKAKLVQDMYGDDPAPIVGAPLEEIEEEEDEDFGFEEEELSDLMLDEDQAEEMKAEESKEEEVPMPYLEGDVHADPEMPVNQALTKARCVYETCWRKYKTRISSHIRRFGALEFTRLPFAVSDEQRNDFCKDLQGRGAGLFAVTGPVLLASLNLHHYVQYLTKEGRFAEAAPGCLLLYGVTTPRKGCFGILDQTNCLAYMLELPDNITQEYEELHDPNILYMGIAAALEKTGFLVLLGVEQADWKFLTDVVRYINSHGGNLQVVVSGEIEGLTEQQVAFPLTDLTSPEEVIPLKSLVSCLQSNCAHRRDLGCLKQLRDLAVFGQLHLWAVPGVLDAGSRRAIVELNNRPPQTGQVDNAYLARYLMLHRQVQTDVSNIMTIVTEHETDARFWNDFYSQTVRDTMRVQQKSVVAFESIAVAAAGSEFAPATREEFFQSVDVANEPAARNLLRVAEMDLFVGQRVVLLTALENLQAGSLGTIIGLTNGRPLVCFDSTRASVELDMTELEAFTRNGMWRVSAVVFPIWSAFAVTVPFLNYCNVADMIAFCVKGQSLWNIVPALPSLTCLFLYNEEIPADVYAQCWSSKVLLEPTEEEEEQKE